jgi:hypothetical protein
MGVIIQFCSRVHVRVGSVPRRARILGSSIKAPTASIDEIQYVHQSTLKETREHGVSLALVLVAKVSSIPLFFSGCPLHHGSRCDGNKRRTLQLRPLTR